jgi:hypothetical protein
MGYLFTQQDFWGEVSKLNPSLMEQILEVLNNVIAKARASLDKVLKEKSPGASRVQAAEELLKSATRVRGMMAGFLADNAANTGSAAATEDAAMELDIEPGESLEQAIIRLAGENKKASAARIFKDAGLFQKTNTPFEAYYLQAQQKAKDAASKPQESVTPATTQVTPPQDATQPTGAQTAQPRQAMTLRDIGLSQMQDQNVQTAESSREIEDVRKRGSIEATGDRNFPTARLDKTLKRAEQNPEALQAARTFVEASEKRSAAEKSLNDAITNNANPVERARLTQDAVKAREEYNQAIQNIDIDQTDQTETPSSFQEKGRPGPNSRAKTEDQIKRE